VEIKFRVRPRALNRKPFLVKRKFNRDHIRAVFMDRSSTPVSPRDRRLSEELQSRGEQLRDRRRLSDQDTTALVAGSNTTPIHYDYARIYFPLLADILSGRLIQPGDIIDIPMPHPEAWTQTVAYVYTGQGELTEAIRRNVMFLGGKV